MSPGLQKLVGQAVIRLINGDKQKAAELSSEAYEIWLKSNHLHATIEEILDYKNKRRKLA